MTKYVSVIALSISKEIVLEFVTLSTNTFESTFYFKTQPERHLCIILLATGHTSASPLNYLFHNIDTLLDLLLLEKYFHAI